MGRRLTRTVGLALAAGALLAACTPAGPPRDPTPTATPAASPSPSPGVDASPSVDPGGGSLRFMLRYDPEFIVPAFVIEPEGRIVVDALFDGLTALDDGLRPVPAAAADWTAAEDGTSYTFRLRTGMTFHDGTPVDAEAFVRGLNRVVTGVRGEPSPNAYHLASVVGYDETLATGAPLAGVVAESPTTLRIDLAEPDFDLPAVLAHPALAPLPAAADDVTAFREQPIGNGPFRMAQGWEHDQFIRVVPFAGYWQAPSTLDEVVFQIYRDGDEDLAFEDFREGQLDYAYVPASQLGLVAGEFGRSPDGRRGPGFVDGASLTLYYLGFNVTLPPFDDPDVRRAISLLVDREAIATDVLAGTRDVATSITPPAIPGAEPDTCAWCRYEPAEAAALLAEKDVAEFVLAIDDHPVQRAIAERISADITAATGIPVRLQSRDYSGYLQDVREGRTAFFRLGWEAEYATLDNFVTTLVAGRSIGTTNVTRFASEDVDALVAQARATADPDERAATFVAAERLALDAAPLVPVFFYRHDVVVADRVEGLVVRADGAVDLRRVRLGSGA